MFGSCHVEARCRTDSVVLRQDHAFEPHVHRGHELLWDTTGRFTVTTDEGLWHVPPLMGVLVPSERMHGGDGAAGVHYRSTRFDARDFRLDAAEPVLVHVPAAASALLLHAHQRPGLRDDVRARSVRLAFDLLTPASSAIPTLPRPFDSRAIAVADALVADPADQRTIGEWGRAVGASSRTLARVFRSETGLTFGQWRTRLRIAEAMLLLAAGATVASTARRVGYHTPSAFVRAFRMTAGRPPATWAAGARAECGPAVRP
ncbi:AraC family transcriptional regulator [Desertimonas flava]|uniref:AraC family transcriptional regulator n=1 Tax=Desertimonas flava TaxID=2064846 RepID=UPI001968F455|nr:AraC family transcriptional regulator [Desertimonas flava]